MEDLQESIRASTNRITSLLSHDKIIIGVAFTIHSMISLMLSVSFIKWATRRARSRGCGRSVNIMIITISLSDASNLHHVFSLGSRAQMLKRSPFKQPSFQISYPNGGSGSFSKMLEPKKCVLEHMNHRINLPHFHFVQFVQAISSERAGGLRQDRYPYQTLILRIPKTNISNSLK